MTVERDGSSVLSVMKMNANLTCMNIAHVNTTMLRVLVSLAETRSFSRTAERLCLTQSAVSHAVRGLETAVGTQLVVRDRMGLEFTFAGESALGSASAALDALRALLSAGRQALAGTVRLASVVSASTAIVPEVLALARRYHPDLKVTLLVGTDAEVMKWVETGIADIGLAYDAGEDCEPLIDDQLYAIAAARSRFGRENAPAGAVDFDRVDFVMSAAGCGPMLERLFCQWNVRPNIVTSVSDMSALFAIVGAGHGVSIVPGLSFPTDWRDRVARRRLHPQERRPLTMKVQNKSPEQALSGLMAILREACRTAGQTQSLDDGLLANDMHDRHFCRSNFRSDREGPSSDLVQDSS